MDLGTLTRQIPALRRYARALTGDAWAADDLVQDTLERACAKWRLWIVGSDIRAWLFTIMHNLFASQVRRSSNRATVDIDDLTQELAGPDEPRDQAIDLQRCLLLLPDEQRAVLLLIALEDLSYAQVASILNIPMGTVMSRLARARARLQELMEGKPAPMPRRSGLRRLK